MTFTLTITLVYTAAVLYRESLLRHSGHCVAPRRRIAWAIRSGLHVQRSDSG